MNRSLTGGMKLAAKQLMDDGQLCDLRFGTVVSVSPLKVQITNLLTLPQSVLIVPEHLTNYEVNVTIDWETEELKDLKGTKTMTVNNALKVGDKVALIRKTGGQSYYILDRI